MIWMTRGIASAMLRHRQQQRHRMLDHLPALDFLAQADVLDDADTYCGFPSSSLTMDIVRCTLDKSSRLGARIAFSPVCRFHGAARQLSRKSAPSL